VVAIAQNPDTGGSCLSVSAYITATVYEINAKLGILFVDWFPMSAASEAAAYLTLGRVQLNVGITTDSIRVSTAHHWYVLHLSADVDEHYFAVCAGEHIIPVA